MKNVTKKIVGFILDIMFSLAKIDDNKILFESGRGKVDGNPKALYKYIIDNCPKDFRTVWLIEKGTDKDIIKDNDCFFYRTFKGYYQQATSKYWIKSQSIDTPLRKRKGQIYIQIYHGAGAMKKCGYDVTGTIGPCVDFAKDWDYFIATDKPNSICMASSMGLDKKIIKLVGGASTDSIVNATQKDRQDILKKLNIKTKKKIILYVPTFRDSDLGNDNFDLPIMRMGKLKDYLVLIRLHPQLKNILKGMKLPKNFIDVGNYPDVQDLMLITDLFIGDYSSAVFSYSLLNKPMIFYTYDYDNYMKERGFYLDFKKEIPGKLVYNEDELINTINNIEKENKKYENKVLAFNKKFNNLNDGHVCERMVKKLKAGYFK